MFLRRFFCLNRIGFYRWGFVFGGLKREFIFFEFLEDYEWFFFRELNYFFIEVGDWLIIIFIECDVFKVIFEEIVVK